MANLASGKRGLRSVDNALRLLHLVGERQVLRVAEVADALGVAPSTAHRLLTALSHRGFVLQDKPNSAYRPGPALNAIGLAAIGRIDIRRIARPVLEELAESAQETVSLCLLEGRSVRFIDCVESPRPVRVGDRTGVVMPAHCTAAGKAILAGMSFEDLKRLYPDGELWACTDASIATWGQLLTELDSIRDNGYAINIEEGENGVSAVGTSVLDLHGTPLMALAIVVPSSRLHAADAGHALGPLLLQARERIARLLRTAP